MFSFCIEKQVKFLLFTSVYFSLPISLYLKCFLQKVHGYITLTQSERFDLLIGVFGTFTFSVITEIIGHRPILEFL